MYSRETSLASDHAASSRTGGRGLNVATQSTHSSTPKSASRARRVDGFTTTSAGSGIGTTGTATATMASELRTTRTADEHRRGASQLGRFQSLVTRVDDALDEMRDGQHLFLGRYIVLGALERRSGGQGVVQFMRGAHNSMNYAAKVRSG